MNCFPCFSSKNNDENNNSEEVPVAQPARDPAPPAPSPPRPVYNAPASPMRPLISNNEASNHSSNNEVKNHNTNNEVNAPENGDSGARTFTFRELAMATKNFRQEHLLGEGGFGKLYKGTLQTGEVVAVKRLDRIGTQGNKEFIVEVLMLTLLKHPNLVSLLGYCADGEQRLLVYEYLPLGSLRSYIHDLPADRKPLDWQTRMKIASGAAQGLEYLHEKANPAIVYRDLKLSHILVDEEFNPKLSDYGLAKLAQGDSKSHVTARVMGSGYCAPEYERHGELTTKSDIYSFGVVLLELITGRKAIDTSRPSEEQNLVVWAQSFFKDPKRFPEMADPLLKKEFPERNLNQAVGIAAMCLQDEPSVRPLVGDLVALLSFLAVAPAEETMAQTMSAPDPASELKESDNDEEDHKEDSDSSDSESGEESHDEHDESISKSDHESDSSSESSDDEDNRHDLHQESKKLEKKSSSLKHNKQKSRKVSSSRKVKKMESDISFTSSISSKSSHSAAAPHGKVSVISRQNSIEESKHGSFGSGSQRGKNAVSFSWSRGSSSRYKSRNGSGRVDPGSNKNIELHDHESEGGSYSSSDYSDDEIEHKSES